MTTKLELVGIAEIASLTGVTKQAVTNWRGRHRDFPESYCELKSGPVWLLTDIKEWTEKHGITFHPPAAEQSVNQRRKSMSVIAGLTNMKGGVGKSTIAANLGWFCAYYKNLRVLFVDLDPQFNLSQYLMGPDRYETHLNDGKSTVVEVFEQFTPSIVSGKKAEAFDRQKAIANISEWTDGSRLDLIPSRLELAWTLKNPHSKEHLLRDFLEEVKDGYDLVLIDCPPTESMLTTAAYLASDYLLVPVKPEFLSTIGLPLLVRSLEEFRGLYKRETPPKLAGILFNHTGDKIEHDRSRAFVKKLARDNGWYVFKNEVGFSDSYPSGARTGKPIFFTEYARSWKKAELQNVAEEFVSQVGLT